MTAGKPIGADLDRLEQRLVLHNWINDLLGYGSTGELLSDLKDADEGFDGEGRSYVLARIMTRPSQLKVSRADLERYDENIRHHVESINRNRAEPIVLKYFQHLAALYTELLLDHRFNRREELVRDLNAYARMQEDEPIRFTVGDLDRAAFWMATGSGKTLLMHLNYLQFLHYNRKGGEPLDNILLITPNARLTEQHLKDMKLSGIPCERFSGTQSVLNLGERNIVRATEITKVKEEKKGAGVSVDVESFEGRNLVFVDEGHKGAATGLKSGEEQVWLNIRRRLGNGGFTFEYSATFGQSLAKGSNKEKTELIEGYGKSILFDYSYRYFYGDGYGKDFRLLNLKDSGGEYQDLLLLGNLISFYQQKLCYADLGEMVEEYNLSPPLWIMVGSKVDSNAGQRSDVYDVTRFFHRFLKNEDGWSVGNIERLIKGESGLRDGDGRDVFEHSFRYLKKQGRGAEDLFRDILRQVFRAEAGGALAVGDIRGADGELGLRVSGAEEGYFGLIYVGETKKLKDLIEERSPDIVVEDDVIGGALFAGIEVPDSPVNVLIGARKFVEGWSSWRVSNMGLINVGGSEGPMIVQLFGRGVRLKGKTLGKALSLKRSSALDGNHPAGVAPLETLDVFGLRANYMVKFRETLEREGVDPEGYEELPVLPLQKNEEFLQEGLMIPRPSEEEFVHSENVELSFEENISVSLDLSARLQTGRMREGRLEAGTAKSEQEPRKVDDPYLAMLDWREIHLDLLEFKSVKGLWNLSIPSDMPRALMEEHRTFYRLIADQETVMPETFAGLGKLREVVQSLLRKYVEKSYHLHQQRWDSERMTIEPLTESHANFADYRVMVRRSSRRVIEEVTDLLQTADAVYRTEAQDAPLPRLIFDRHLFQPLVLEGDDRLKTTPVGLNDSERNFVNTLRAYCHNGADHSGKKLFLLRNLSRGKGIGFFKTAGFYPDFILWVKHADGSQKVAFVEPHGMRNDNPPPNNDKVNLYLALEDLSDRIVREDGPDFHLDSYVVSATPYEELSKKWGEGWTRDRFARKHVLFEDDLEERIPDLLAPRDELERRVFDAYPQPLASGFRSLTRTDDPRELYQEQLRFAENLLAFLASISLALVRKEDREGTGLNLAGYWCGGISPGDWRDIVRLCSKTFTRYDDPLAMSIRKLKIQSHTKGFGKDVDALIRAKNDFKHDRGPKTLEATMAASDEVQETIRRCMGALESLTDHPVHRSDDSGTGLHLVTGEGVQLPLWPFLVWGTMLGRHDGETYFVDAWDTRKGTARMKSFERGHTTNSAEVAQALSDWG